MFHMYCRNCPNGSTRTLHRHHQEPLRRHHRSHHNDAIKGSTQQNYYNGNDEATSMSSLTPSSTSPSNPTNPSTSARSFSKTTLLKPFHLVSLQQRLLLCDDVVDLVQCRHAMNQWIPLTAMEFLLLDVDRVLRGGGYLWVDNFFSKRVDLEKMYASLIRKLGYKTT